MRLTRLNVRDFGLFRGVQTIELAPRIKYGRPRPIVLIGGHNGAGKTTILDAVRLCLYGRVALGRVTDAEYHAYLRERIHRYRDSLIPVTTASVGVEFDYSRAGETARYAVTRSWDVRGATGVAESLSVLRNGQPLDDVGARSGGTVFAKQASAITYTRVGKSGCICGGTSSALIVERSRTAVSH